jgi:deoxyribodipyrimidine photo-lyase
LAEPPVIVWFRRDLRLADHPALTKAAAAGAPLLPLYSLDELTPGEFRPGGASRWWLDGSLAALDRELSRHGGSLCLRKGRTPEVLAALIAESGARAVHATRCYEPWEAALEAEVARLCAARGVDFSLSGGRVLFEPETMLAGGKPYRVFTPFWRACRKAPAPPTPLPVPQSMRFTAAGSDRLADWKLRPAKPDWAGGLRASWIPGEAAARAKLAQFVTDRLEGYADARDRLDLDASSRLSPHLHFGELSPGQVWHAAAAATANAGRERGAESFLRELVWREFAAHQLFHFPLMASQPLKPDFERFPWRDDPAALSAWQRGATGYPIVDAAMRELWQTGFMPNRARMIAASFLTKHLLIPWQEGAHWFLDALVDADLASNAANWQWVAGSGVDAAPYFRIFNPVLQGRKFDPEGAYVRRFVPELAALPARFIHAPWEAPPLELAAAGVRLGETYPEPIVDHGKARARALAAFATLRA